MSIEAGIYSYLTTDATTAALIGTRLYPVLAPAGAGDAGDYAVFQRISTTRVASTDGPTGVTSSTWQIVCWSSTQAGAIALADAVRQALDGYKGAMGSETTQRCAIIDQAEEVEISPEQDEKRAYSQRLDFEIWYTETP